MKDALNKIFDHLKSYENFESYMLNEDRRANSNMRCDSLKSLMIINKLSKFL